MTQNKGQFVKALPHGEIELHGDDETLQCNAGAITSMKIHVNDGMEHQFVEGKCERVQVRPLLHILVVVIGYDTENHYAERITFSAPTEEGVEEFRNQINKIRYPPRWPAPSEFGLLQKVKSALKVKS